MVNWVVFQNAYLTAEYFYLHFQYNGWFFFGRMGLLNEVLRRVDTDPRLLTQMFWLFWRRSIPAMFSPLLWMDPGADIYTGGGFGHRPEY